MRDHRKAALQVGYGFIIALLIFASAQAYRILTTVSERHLETYRRHVRHDEVITDLRRTIWLAGNATREFFIDPRAEHAVELRKRLTTLRAEADTALAELLRVTPREDAAGVLREAMQDFWETMEPVSKAMLNTGTKERLEFVRREIIPRRSTLSGALKELSRSDQDALKQSEIAFSQARRSAAQHLIVILASCVILAVVIARWSTKYATNLERQAQRQFEEVTRAKRELEALSARLVDLEEEWRKRFSRELHDEIGQTLAALQIEISGAAGLPEAQHSPLQGKLSRARALTQRSVQIVRNVALLLRPALLDDLGLVPALEWLTEDFTKRSGIGCAFHEEDSPAALPDAIKTCIYRIVQESLHNAEKHAGASRARVVLRGIGNAVEVDIEDDGRGFAEKSVEKPAGLGILGMRERATRLGGTLVLKSRPGEGTRVHLRVPLPTVAARPQIQEVKRGAAAG
jgi:signal transduction histidine kinase